MISFLLATVGMAVVHYSVRTERLKLIASAVGPPSFLLVMLKGIPVSILDFKLIIYLGLFTYQVPGIHFILTVSKHCS